MLGWLVEKNSPWPAGAEMIRLRVFLLRHKDLSLSLTLDLVILHPFVFLYPIHQLVVHILRKLDSKGLSQVRIHGKPHFEGADHHIFEIPINFMKELLIYI